jgi:vitamin B12/bleomycin/antimicrobial peptide transport system ATP-binding/permease protein
VLERRKGGAKLVSDIDLVPRKGKRRLLGRFLRQRKTVEKKTPEKKASAKKAA